MLRSFVYTTLFAATLASAAITVETTGPTAQCGELSVSWKGNSGAVDVYLFPGCDEEEENPVFESLDLESGSTVIPLPYKAGTTWKVEVYDSKNNTDSSDEFTLTGDWTKFKDCSKDQIAEISSSSVAATSTATTTAGTDGSAPTTQSVSTTRGAVNNAAAGGSSTASAASATQSTNGASALMSKPFGFTAGIVLAVSVALSL